MLITRTINPADLDVITEWWYQEWKDEYRQIGIDSLQETRLAIYKCVQNETIDIFIVREGTTIVSSAAIFLNRESAKRWLTNIYTHPEYRYRGYGTQLVREILRHMSYRIYGDNKLYLLTTPDLLHWYTEIGFKEISHDSLGNITMCMTLEMFSPTLFM
jgi:predicted GNAT family acetyltransferase